MAAADEIASQKAIAPSTLRVGLRCMGSVTENVTLSLSGLRLSLG